MAFNGLLDDFEEISTGQVTLEHIDDQIRFTYDHLCDVVRNTLLELKIFRFVLGTHTIILMLITSVTAYSSIIAPPFLSDSSLIGSIGSLSFVELCSITTNLALSLILIVVFRDREYSVWHIRKITAFIET